MSELSANYLSELSSAPAPKEWERILRILAHKPRGSGEKALHRLVGTDICVWMVSSAGWEWSPTGRYFLVTGPESRDNLIKELTEALEGAEIIIGGLSGNNMTNKALSKAQRAYDKILSVLKKARGIN
jgi:hypothetical protein